MKTRLGISLVLFAITLSGVNSLGQTHKQEVQSAFSAEDNAWKRPAQIPDEMLSTLKTDGFICQHLEGEELVPDKLPASCFLASEVHLGGSGEKDFVVMGVGSLRGANVNTFWVFMQTKQGYKLVLTLPTHDLVIEERRWKGHRNISALAATAVRSWEETFRFDGREYKHYSIKNFP